MLSRKNHLYIYNYVFIHTLHIQIHIYLHAVLQSGVLCDTANVVKEWITNMVLFISFYFSYNAYCMPV